MLCEHTMLCETIHFMCLCYQAWASPRAHLCVYLHVAPAEADFVGSALVRESVNSSVGDDDKIYFFFTEKSQEQTAFGGQGRVARVARICKVSLLPSRERLWPLENTHTLFTSPSDTLAIHTPLLQLSW